MRTLLRGTILLVLPLLLVGGLASAARAAGPVVSSFNPTSGPVGTVVTINGSGFGAGSVAYNGGVSLTTIGITPTSITII